MVVPGHKVHSVTDELLSLDVCLLRLTKGEAMSGSSYRLRYEVVARDRDVKTDLGRGRLLFKHLLDCNLVSRVFSVLNAKSGKIGNQFNDDISNNLSSVQIIAGIYLK